MPKASTLFFVGAIGVGLWALVSPPKNENSPANRAAVVVALAATGAFTKAWKM